jgi:hypothetical protein
MRLSQQTIRGGQRRGVILMVVLALLTLFAIVGIAFVLYADSEAMSARISKEAESLTRAEVDPEQVFAAFLGQFLYDVPDNYSGVGSALRGHSLARNMYGANTGVANTIPFNGTGRLHFMNQGGPGWLAGVDDWMLVNYTWFSSDGFLRDPERVGIRGNPAAGQGAYVGGFNAPYTYPDLNSFFLAAVKADGTVLSPSFHRKWLFNPNNNFNDMSNPNWSNPQGKYFTLRPRPNEHPQFPPPDDATGDVRNLPWSKGGNDSIWIDIGMPVMTAPDGTAYKALVAPLILDLDSRINLSVAGNMLGQGQSHVSNQGWGPWEINLAKVLYGDNPGNPGQGTEYRNLFNNNTAANPPGRLWGKYGPAGVPGPSNPQNLIPGRQGHYYAPGDINGLNEANNAAPSSAPQVPGLGGPANSCWPSFPQGYLGGGGVEPTNHPALYPLLRSPLWAPPGATYGTNLNRIFGYGSLEALLRPNSLANIGVGQNLPDTGSAALLSPLVQLCPQNFGVGAPNPRFRNLVTPQSWDIGSPGVMPWWYNNAANTFVQNPNNAAWAPVGSSINFPTVNPQQANVSNAPTEFGADWRALTAALGPVNLNRPMPPYPHMGSGMANGTAPPPYGGWGAALVGTNIPWNNQPANGQVMNQFLAAQTARQSLATDIYNRLIQITGLIQANDPNFIVQRWLAQLAVNIVDFIDEDDISTPFLIPGAPNNTVAVVPANLDPDGELIPTGWVFGTEAPRVVVNEVLAETQDASLNPTVAVVNPQVRVWVELANTMQAAQWQALPNVQPIDAYRIPFYMTDGTTSYSPYRITVCTSTSPPTAYIPLGGLGNGMMGNVSAPTLVANGNVIGEADPTAYKTQTKDADFAAPAQQAGGGGNQLAPAAPVQGPNVSPGIDPQTPNSPNSGEGYLLIGPPADGNKSFTDPFVASNANPAGTVPPTTPVVRTANMQYTPNFVANAVTDERTFGLTIMLRRLANPYMPYQGNPGLGNYNPYVTVDYVSQVPLRSSFPAGAALAGPIASRGKKQPLAGLTLVNAANVSAPQATSLVVDQTPAVPGAATTNPPFVSHTFGIQNLPLPQKGYYDWLVQLDRPLISPMELLHVSGFQPYQLTQQFMLQDDPVANLPTSVNRFRHYVPWFDSGPATCPWCDATLAAGQSHRLYRLFEWVQAMNHGGGQYPNGQVYAYPWNSQQPGLNNLTPIGRVPGKVNINTVWDPEILAALYDANSSMMHLASDGKTPEGVITDGQVYNAGNWGDTTTIFGRLLASRSPNGTPWITDMNGATDSPFLSFGIGPTPAVDTQSPGGLSIQNTLLRGLPLSVLNGMPAPINPAARLFQSPNDTPDIHPYLQTQPLVKIFNNLTTRSNVFAVWLTVGYFQVTNASTTPPQLGAEIGKAEGRQVRHRMFALVDRTNMMNFSMQATTGQTITAPSVNATGQYQPQGLNLPTVLGRNQAGVQWSIATGTQLVIDAGTDCEEVVTVTAVNGNQIQAVFTRDHGVGGIPITVGQRGNPGPWTRYDPRQDPLVVPYFTIIE